MRYHTGYTYGNNASEYQTNGLYRTHNPNCSPLARQSDALLSVPSYHTAYDQCEQLAQCLTLYTGISICSQHCMQCMFFDGLITGSSTMLH